MIIVKSKKIFLDLLLVAYDPVLISIIGYIDKKYGKVVITSGFRKGDTGVHGTIACRGMDIRSHVYHSPKAEVICEDINSKWQYDPERKEKKVAMVHDVGVGIHLHLQVHPNTVYMEKKA